MRNDHILAMELYCVDLDNQAIVYVIILFLAFLLLFIFKAFENTHWTRLFHVIEFLAILCN